MPTENRLILQTADKSDLIVAEQTTCKITGTLKDESGVALALATLDTLTLRLLLKATGAVILATTDIKNVGRGTVHATSGLVTITLTMADNSIVDTTRDLEYHRAQVRWTYSSGAKGGFMEIDFPVRNLQLVP